jgi:hypothetical protein
MSVDVRSRVSDKFWTGGRGGIRTHGALAGTPVFKTGALNHSATLPSLDDCGLAKRAPPRKGQLACKMGLLASAALVSRVVAGDG